MGGCCADCEAEAEDGLGDVPGWAFFLGAMAEPGLVNYGFPSVGDGKKACVVGLSGPEYVSRGVYRRAVDRWVSIFAGGQGQPDYEVKPQLVLH